MKKIHSIIQFLTKKKHGIPQQEIDPAMQRGGWEEEGDPEAGAEAEAAGPADWGGLRGRGRSPIRQRNRDGLMGV